MKTSYVHNIITLQYRHSLYVPQSTGKLPERFLLALQTDLSQLGFTLDGLIMSALQTATPSEFESFRKFLISELKHLVGDNVKYQPLFKNFPDDIPDDTEYLLKRIAGFVCNICNVLPENAQPLSCGHVIDPMLFDINKFGACPICQQQTVETSKDSLTRPNLDEITPLRVIHMAKVDDAYNIFSNLISAKSSISDRDKKAIELMIKEDRTATQHIPTNIVLKENIALVCGLLIKYNKNYSTIISSLIKTATDVLRLAVYLSGGDVSLKEKTKFKLSNKERNIIMSLLDGISNPLEDMLTYRMRWIRLGEVLHVGTKKKRFPNAFNTFDELRNHPENIQSFGSKVESLVQNIKSKTNQQQLLEVLQLRPGVFARRLDFLLCNVNNSIVIEKFNSLIPQLTTKMLLTLKSHLNSRIDKQETRFFMPKGNVCKIQVIDETRPILNVSSVRKIIVDIEEEIISRFKEFTPLGNVLINPKLKNYVLPFSQRSSTNQLKLISRGSRVDLPENSTIRMFLYWKEENSRTDVDLSAICYDNDWNYVNHISYTNLSASFGTHSGDVQSAPLGASEFVDIDIEKALKNGIRYIGMNVISYTGQPFNTFESFAGIMGRNNTSSGEIYEPRTVKDKFDNTGNTRYNIPFLIDLKTRQMLWMDVALTTRIHTNVEHNTKIKDMFKAVDSFLYTKPNILDLLMLHMKARATSVEFEHNKDKKYDLIIDEDFASQIDEILSNWI